MPTIHGTASFAGIPLSLQSFRYTVSHGVSPGIAQLVINPTDAPIPEFGDLFFTDNVNTLIIPRCKLDTANGSVDGSGQTVTLNLLDRRWQWRDLGAISGWYNQRDEFGKYKPWTLRTPSQLVALCLEAMGERNYVIRVPDLTYPPVDWQVMPPALMLAQLADTLACRVVYRLDTDTVWVVPIGEGLFLPDGPEWSVFLRSPALDSPERPDRIDLYGAPLRFQWRFATEAVGLDWDKYYRPIDELSYAPPLSDRQKQRYRITPASLDVGNVLTLIFRYTGEQDVLAQVEYTTTDATVATACAGLTAAVNEAGLPFFATDNTTSLTIESDDQLPYEIECIASPGAGSNSPTLSQELLAAPNDKASRWATCPPPTFTALRATDRLTRRQAIDLAQRSVFRCFRIKTPIQTPGYFGRIDRIQQILLQPTRVEQVEPTPLDERLIDDDGQRRIVHFYDGHSRDKPAAAYGSYFLWTTDRRNSDPEKEIPISFTIDAEHGIITFSQFLVYDRNGTIEPPDIVLETGCNVRSADTNAIELFRAYFVFPGQPRGTGAAVIHQEDCQLNIQGVYEPGVLINPIGIISDQEFAEARAIHYLAGAAAKYQLTGAQTIGYNGILPFFLDGAISQITWEIGPEGCGTTVSRNCEHSVYVPPYPIRRRAEYLAPAGVAARQAQANRFAPAPYDPPRGNPYTNGDALA